MLTSALLKLRFARAHAVHRRARSVIEAWQGRHLQKLVRHTREHVPMYKELYQDLRPFDESFALRDIASLPVVPKKMYLGKPVEEYTDNSQPRTGTWVTTSGTSGQPFTILIRPQFFMQMHADFIRYRFLSWLHPWRSATSFRIVRILPKSHQRKNCLFISITEFLSDKEAAIQKIIEFKPEIIEAYASILHELAKALEKRPNALTPTYAILCGEQSSAGLREAVSRGLGAELFDRYGLEEFGGGVATECAAHDGLHVHAESLIVEIVDDAGRTVPDGTEGRVVVTDLFNYRMPFIRYDTGDRGKMTSERCACGLDAPRMWIEGRYSISLMFDGRPVHHSELDGALETFMNAIIQYQVAKRAENEIVVKVIPGELFNAETQEHMIEKIRPLVGPRVGITVQCVDSISKSPRGKSQIVVDETLR